MIVKLLTEHHLEFLSLKGRCTGSSESTHVKMPHCWKSHVAAQIVTYNASISAVGGVVVTILGSPLYSLTLFGSLLQILSFSSFLSFEPKYLETQFAIPAWQSNLIIGTTYFFIYSS